MPSDHLPRFLTSRNVLQLVDAISVEEVRIVHTKARLIPFAIWGAATSPPRSRSRTDGCMRLWRLAERRDASFGCLKTDAAHNLERQYPSSSRILKASQVSQIIEEKNYGNSVIHKSFLRTTGCREHYQQFLVRPQLLSKNCNPFYQQSDTLPRQKYTVSG